MAQTATSAEAAAVEVLKDRSQRQSQQIGDPHLMLCDDPSHVPFDEAMPFSSDEIGDDEFESGLPKKRHRSPFRRRQKADKQRDKEDASPRRHLSMHKKTPAKEAYGSSPLERDTTGTPFLRVRSPKGKSRSKSSDRDDSGTARKVESRKTSRPASVRDESSEHSSFRETESEDYQKSHRLSSRKQNEHHQASVAVGVSRLHLVKMPDLKVCERETLDYQ